MGITNSGTLAFSVAASVESTLCSAQVMSENGNATLRIAITNRWPYMPIRRGSASRAISTTAASSEEAEQEPDGDEGEGVRPGVNPDLDEQVAAAPEEAEQHEEEPVDSGAALVHAEALVGRCDPWVFLGRGQRVARGNDERPLLREIRA